KPRKPSTTRPPVLPKYRDEVSGQTWTGRGKPPLWLKAMLDQGKTKEDFLIQNAVSETPEQ
ncbi:MAG: H-NS histone family protein, partial [Oxalobacteraceae bacterium]|nr:H-NS histone family protein [Oxalobacteraceae bacterium]